MFFSSSLLESYKDKFVAYMFAFLVLFQLMMWIGLKILIVMPFYLPKPSLVYKIHVLLIKGLAFMFHGQLICFFGKLHFHARIQLYTMNYIFQNFHPPHFLCWTKQQWNNQGLHYLYEIQCEFFLSCTKHVHKFCTPPNQYKYDPIHAFVFEMFQRLWCQFFTQPFSRLACNNISHPSKSFLLFLWNGVCTISNHIAFRIGMASESMTYWFMSTSIIIFSWNANIWCCFII